jgi:5-methylcytosine-specific restriction protein B
MLLRTESCRHGVGDNMRSDLLEHVQATFRDQFLPAKDEKWLSSYMGAVQEVAAADETLFRSRDFQKRLWEFDAISSIGSGNSVTVSGAYDDPEIVDALWGLKTWTPPELTLERARNLDSQF